MGKIKIRLIVLGLIALVLCFGVRAVSCLPIQLQSSNSDADHDLDQMTKLTGRIVVIGNEPFTQLAIEVEDEVYGLIGDRVDELWELQDAIIEVTGFIEDRTPPSFRTEHSINVIDFKVIQSSDADRNLDQKWAGYLGLTLDEFVTVSTAVREYLYQEYSFLR